MSRIGKIARRTFLVGSAAIIGGVAFGAWTINRPAPNPLKPDKGEAALTPFVLINADGVTLIAPRAEMGQGTRTTWAALIAEELDVTLAQVNVIHGPPAKAYYNSALLAEALPGKGYDQSGFMHALGQQMGKVGKLLNLQVTGGSTSMKDGFLRMRLAGATAREALKDAAALRLGVTVDQLRTKDGAVIAPDGARLPYGALASEAAGVDLRDPGLRDPAQWTLLGRAQPRVDMVEKVTGTAQFGIDIRLPGLKFAALRANPARAGMNGFDASAAQAMAGVERVVDLGDAIAVVASNTWLAMQALDAVDVDWQDATYPADTDAIFARIKAVVDEDTK